MRYHHCIVLALALAGPNTCFAGLWDYVAGNNVQHAEELRGEAIEILKNATRLAEEAKLFNDAKHYASMDQLLSKATFVDGRPEKCRNGAAYVDFSPSEISFCTYPDVFVLLHEATHLVQVTQDLSPLSYSADSSKYECSADVYAIRAMWIATGAVSTGGYDHVVDPEGNPVCQESLDLQAQLRR